MPLYDRRCDNESCGYTRGDCYEPITCDPPPCPTCGGPMSRVWLMGVRTVAVIGDEIPGGLTLENLDHKPVTVYSRSELKREMAARGLVPFVRHQPAQGSDKSKITTRWV